MIENNIGNTIVSAAIEVHRTLGGPGLLESVYEEALIWELVNRKVFKETLNRKVFKIAKNF